MLAKKIKMKPGCNKSHNLQEIESVYIDGCQAPGLYLKEHLYDYLQQNPRTIKVAIAPYPHLIPVKSSRGEKYVKSIPNQSSTDNLLSLPRI